MGWQDAAHNWREVPVGMSKRRIWLDAAYKPTIASLGFAYMLCGFFIMHHFTGNTEVAVSKEVRENPNHQGGTDRRIRIHNHHLGGPELSKHHIKAFPFEFTPKEEIIAQHRTD